MKSAPRMFPAHRRALGGVGENLRHARLRRHLPTAVVAERAGISRSTLHKIERGDPSVAMGNYFLVLNSLGLADGFAQLAADDPLGRAIQDAELPTRAPRRRSP